jgi:predicted esterase
MEALANGVCHFDGNKGGRTSLVVFLHGLIARNTTWQWTQERAILRQAKQFGFAAIVPRAPAVGPGGSGGFAWPDGAPDESVEGPLIQEWTDARRELEARMGHPFDDVFVVGFSSGAYFATSLAMRGRLDVDGYVLLAGARPPKNPPTEVKRRPPIFVGVSTEDRYSSPGARALGGSLAIWGWPSRIDEEPVGHMVSDLHMAKAIPYLRRAHPLAR